MRAPMPPSSPSSPAGDREFATSGWNSKNSSASRSSSNNSSIRSRSSGSPWQANSRNARRSATLTNEDAAMNRSLSTDGVIAAPLPRFLTDHPEQFRPGEGPVALHGALRHAIHGGDLLIGETSE